MPGRMLARTPAAVTTTTRASVTSPISTAATISSVTSISLVALISVAGGRRFFGLNAHLRVAVCHSRFAGKADTAFFIYAQTLDPDFVAHLDNILGLLHAEIGQLADV